MAPQIRALAKSDSKNKFCERLGLDQNNPSHLQTYRAMKAEAAQARKRIVDEHLTNVSETAMHREVLRTYHLASPQTKRYYDLGHDREGVEEENWIVRWLLWHVFRYRDDRNNKSRRSSNVGEDVVEGNNASSSGADEPRRHQYWDPVRGA